MDDERVIELWITAPRGGTFGVSGYPMVVRRFADVVAAETREECAQYLRDAAARLAPEGKRTNQIDRHTAHVLACKGDELAAARAWCDVGEGGAEMTADEARQKLFSMMREDECHAKTLVNHYADQFESLRQKASKSRKDEFLRELDGRKEVCNRHESDEMIENKTWQHEDTGMMTTCAIRPGNRWHDVCVAPDREHEDLTGKPCADKQDSRLRKDEFLQELDGRKEDERPISMLDRDAIATASAMIRLCGA